MEVFPPNTLHHIVDHDMGGMGGEEDEVKNARARMVAEGDEWKSIDIFQLFPFPQL